MKLTGDIRCDFEKVTTENVKLKDRILGYQETISSLRHSLKTAQKSKDMQRADYEELLAQKDAVIKELENRLAHELALKNHDGTNTGTPTSQTPVGKKKVIPNSRRNTGKKKGGQPGHEKHILTPPDDSTVTETVAHGGGDGFACPDCGSENFAPTGESEIKYEYDIEVKVVRREHVYYYYRCLDCGTQFRSVIEPRLKEKCQYGSMVQAVALSLLDTVNAPVNKTGMFLAGLTAGGLAPCDGYISKLQNRAGQTLVQFCEDLRMLMITRTLLYWDDTVIMINTARACFRFYGDEKIAYYTAHLHKDMESLDDDSVLAFLTADTKIMHDHNRVNYNDKYSFDNIECNQHLQRDCQKNSSDTCHKWSDDLKEHISRTIKDRKDAIDNGASAFDDAYIKKFNKKLDKILKSGWKENLKDPGNYGAHFEETLLKRIEEYRRNYFLWAEDFTLPTTNNLSERGLRGIKSHMKISGQFESETAAQNFARIKTYIETCRRNSINEIHALQRLCEGNPYTVEEIFTHESA